MHKYKIPLFNVVFVTHGGLGPVTSRMTLEQLDKLNRFKEPEFDYEINADPR
jgi:hypothetical protein